MSYTEEYGGIRTCMDCAFVDLGSFSSFLLFHYFFYTHIEMDFSKTRSRSTPYSDQYMPPYERLLRTNLKWKPKKIQEEEKLQKIMSRRNINIIHQSLLSSKSAIYLDQHHVYFKKYNIYVQLFLLQITIFIHGDQH